MERTKGLSEKEISQIREELNNCKRPLYFFHDDADGLSSFILLYKYVHEGKGVIVKARPRIDENYLRVVEEYQPDKIFILDIALVDQEFIDTVKVPVVWIDHHDYLDRKGVKYYNPRKDDPDNNVPASHLCYQIVEDDLWIAMTGIVGDWKLTDIKDKFCDVYPDLLSKKIVRPDVALFDTKVGKLAKIFNFVLKGRTSDAMKCAKILTRIEHPDEILKQSTPRGKFIYRYYGKVNAEYKRLLDDAITTIEKQKKSRLKVYTYAGAKMSYSSELANELLFRYPSSVLVIGREKDDEMKMSLRSPKGISVKDILAKALSGLEGYGGGHEQACGACIKKADWSQFLVNMKEELDVLKAKK